MSSWGMQKPEKSRNFGKRCSALPKKSSACHLKKRPISRGKACLLTFIFAGAYRRCWLSDAFWLYLFVKKSFEDALEVNHHLKMVVPFER